MAEFLSRAWRRELAVACAAWEPPGSLDRELVIEQVVHDGDGGEIRYWLRLGPKGAEVTDDITSGDAGRPGSPDLVLITDAVTAGRLHRGELRAQDALVEGKLKVGGSPERMTHAIGVFATLEQSLATLRDSTTFSGDPAGGDPGPQ
jgi:hypothetical protein